MTDNERDAALIRKVLTVHSGADFLADDFPRLEEGQDAWHALDRLMAALSAATAERDAARAELAAAYGDTTSEWYTALDRERERAEALAAQLQQAREFIARARPLLGIGLGNSLGKQADDLYVAIGAALAAAAPATTLNEAEGEA